MAGTTGSCPSCGSSSIQTVNVRRSTVPKDLAAEYYAAGGAPSDDVIAQIVCGRCGAHWIPRTSQERQLRALSGQLGQDAMRSAEAHAAAPPGAAWRKVPPRAWLVAAIIASVILLAILA